MQMQWEKIAKSSLMSRYASWISHDPLMNNRFIGFLDMANESSRKPRAEAWLLTDQLGRPRIMAAVTSEEFIPLVHPIFPLTPDVVQEIRSEFLHQRLLCLHSQQIEEWRLAVSVIRGPRLPQQGTERWLLAIASGSLRQVDTEFRLMQGINSCDGKVKEFIREFARETSSRELDEADIQACFERNNFFGLFRRAELVSIAALTRWSFRRRCMSYVYTPPTERGQAHAAVLVGLVIERAFMSPLDEIFLYVDAKNASAMRLYEKIGFRRVGLSLFM